MSEKEKALRLKKTIAKKKFETFTKAKELLTKVESEFGEEYANGLYQCFMFTLYANTKLTEDELIEKVLNDIKKDEQ